MKSSLGFESLQLPCIPAGMQASELKDTRTTRQGLGLGFRG